jgi:hypothetical protein
MRIFESLPCIFIIFIQYVQKWVMERRLGTLQIRVYATLKILTSIRFDDVPKLTIIN